jgi:hypothetical protein
MDRFWVCRVSMRVLMGSWWYEIFFLSGLLAGRWHWVGGLTRIFGEGIKLVDYLGQLGAKLKFFFFINDD